MYKTKFISGVLVYFLIFCSIALISFNETSEASETFYYVDSEQIYPDEADGSVYNPFKFIQDAIDAASDGDIIKVLPGDYGENIVIDKSVTLTTENINNTKISYGSLESYMIEITASLVSFEGFTLIDTTTTSHRKAIIHITSEATEVKIINNIIEQSANGYGVFIDGSDKNVIKNNLFNDNRGVKIVNSDTNSVFGNSIWNCGENPSLHLFNANNNIIESNSINNSNYGIYGQEASNNIIRNNTIYENDDTGIKLISGDSNTITNNKIYDHENTGIDLGTPNSIFNNNTINNNNVGLSLTTSSCNIVDCEFLSNNLYGIYARDDSRNNLIFNNTFQDNTASNAKDEGDNQWDNGTYGNYWDDFYGPDPNHDNNTVIYDNDDVPEVYKYKNNGVIDCYPKGIYHQEPTISTPSPAHLEENVERQPVLSVTVTDPENERLNVDFYYQDLDGVNHLIGSANNIESGGEASKWFSSLDTSGEPAYSYKGLGYEYIGLWYVIVKDPYTQVKSTTYIFSTVDTPVDNEKPTANIVVDSKAQFGDVVKFDGSDSNDSDGEIIFYRWTFGDGESELNVQSPTYVYQNPGTYEISLVVIDNNGSSDTISKNIEIVTQENDPPVANLNGPYSGKVKKSVQFTSSGSFDPDNGDSIVSYTWTFGDGETSTEQNPDHKYALAGTYNVTLTVIDQSGLSHTEYTEAIIKTSKSDESPGFEMVFIIIAIALTLISKKKNKK